MGLSEALPSDAESLRRDPAVALVTRDFKLMALGTTPLVPGEVVPSGIARIGAAPSGSVYEPSSKNVAVLDTGVDFGHGDLNVSNGANCIGRA